MTEKDLIAQLKTLKNVHPDQNWVDLTRSGFGEANPRIVVSSINIFERIFAFPIPKMAAIPVMAVLVALVGGVTLVQDANYEEGVFVALIQRNSLSTETKEELKAIADDVAPLREGQEAESYTVVFDEDGDEQESFKDALRKRIEGKIDTVNDLFAQLEDEDLAREISLSPRRYEENFKLADAEIGEQVKSFLADAESALEEGNLIDALDLVNAIEKLLD